MALALDDRVMETSTTTGTGTLTLAGAVTGYQSFAAVGNANTCYYSIEGLDGSGDLNGEWETGIGTYTSSGTTLSRDTVFKSSNSDSLVNLSGSSNRVFVSLPKARLIIGENAPNSRLINGYLVESRSGNAATFAVKNRLGNDPSPTEPVYAVFRSATAGSGAFTVLPITAALSVTASSGSTGGATSGVAFRLWIVLFNDAGTPRLGWVNRDWKLGLHEAALKSSTAEGGAGAADSAQVIYTTSAVTSKAFVLCGYMDYGSGLTTAGTWDAAPTWIQQMHGGVPLPGSIVQTEVSSTATQVTGTTNIPNDDTLPQSGEGQQAMTGTITPTSALNMLEVTHDAWYGQQTSNNICAIAIFKDSETDARRAKAISYNNSGTSMIAANMAYYMVAGTTSQVTYKVRFGPHSGGTTSFLSWAGPTHYYSTAGTGLIICKEIMG